MRNRSIISVIACGKEFLIDIENLKKSEYFVTKINFSNLAGLDNDYIEVDLDSDIFTFIVEHMKYNAFCIQPEYRIMEKIYIMANFLQYKPLTAKTLIAPDKLIIVINDIGMTSNNNAYLIDCMNKTYPDKFYYIKSLNLIPPEFCQLPDVNYKFKEACSCEEYTKIITEFYFEILKVVTNIQKSIHMSITKIDIIIKSYFVSVKVIFKNDNLLSVPSINKLTEAPYHTLEEFPKSIISILILDKIGKYYYNI